MTTGWQKVKDLWYYLDTNGTMMTGWQKINGESYYFHTDGRMLTGWLNDSVGNRYYMSPVSGRMIRGWREIDQHWYYFNSSGHMVKGWLTENGSYYYLDPSNGMMASDCSKTINNVTYTFAKNGACQTNTNLISGAVQADHLANNSTAGSGSAQALPRLAADHRDLAAQIPEVLSQEAPILAQVRFPAAQALPALPPLQEAPTPEVPTQETPPPEAPILERPIQAELRLPAVIWVPPITVTTFQRA